MGAPGDLGRKSLLLVAGTWIASALGFLSTVLIARRLGPEAVGTLGFGFGLAGVMAAALLPGFAQAHTKRVAEGLDLGRCVSTMGVLQLVLHSAMAALVMAASPWWPLVIPEGVPPEVVLFLLIAQVLSNFAAILTGAFLGRQWALEYASVLVASKVLRFAATVAVLIWVPDVRWVAMAYLVEGAAELALGAYVLYGRRGVALCPPDRDTFRSYWTHARPLLVTNPIGMFQDSIDRVLVARWAGLAAAGYYQVARALWEVLGTLNAYPFQMLFTRLSQLFASRRPGEDAEARRVFASLVDKLLFIGVPVAFGLWALREPAIMLLYGDRFLPAAAPLMIFVIAALVQSALNPYPYVIYALNEHARFIPVVLVRFVLYLAAMVATVPLWAGTGAALVRLLLVLFPAWVYVRWTRELVGIGFQRRTLMYAAGFGVLVVVNEGTRASLHALGVSFPLSLLAAMVVALAAYSGLLLSAHPGAVDNLKYSRDLLSPRRFAAFLKADLS